MFRHDLTVLFVRDVLADTISKLREVKVASPGTFDEAEQNRLAEIDEEDPESRKPLLRAERGLRT